jgi:chromosomal replication initiation ATPase DnaA
MAPSRGDDGSRQGWRARQLALDLVPEPCFDREDFLVSGSNERAFAMVELWPNWPEPILLIIGPAGAGKSHLGAIWAARAGARVVPSSDLAEAEPGDLATGPLLVENLENAALLQTRLFHLLNVMRERGFALVLTARRPPEAWGLSLADLLSRLRLAPRVEIGAPDEALLRAVLVKLLIERQLVVDKGLVDYAVLRLDRSLDAARTFVDLLDRQALSRQSRVTRALAAEVLRSILPDEGFEPGDDDYP